MRKFLSHVLTLAHSKQPTEWKNTINERLWLNRCAHAFCMYFARETLEMLDFVYCHVPGALCHCAVCICAQRQHQQWRKQQQQQNFMYLIAPMSLYHMIIRTSLLNLLRIKIRVYAVLCAAFWNAAGGLRPRHFCVGNEKASAECSDCILVRIKYIYRQFVYKMVLFHMKLCQDGFLKNAFVHSAVHCVFIGVLNFFFSSSNLYDAFKYFTHFVAPTRIPIERKT